MKSSTGSTLLKTVAVLIAISLSTTYIIYQWPDNDADIATDADADAPAVEPGEAVAADEPDTAEPADPPDFPGGPGFDLNEALSKTGTIRLDKPTGGKGGGGGLFGDDDENNKKE